MPLDAVSIGYPGMEIGAPARPGFASSRSSVAKTFIAGSGDPMSPWLTSAVTRMLSVVGANSLMLTVISGLLFRCKVTDRLTGRNPATSARTVTSPVACRLSKNRPSAADRV